MILSAAGRLVSLRLIDFSQFHPRPPRKRERCGQAGIEKAKRIQLIQPAPWNSKTISLG